MRAEAQRNAHDGGRVVDTSKEQRSNDRGRLVRILRNLGFGQASADDDLLGLGLSSLKILQFSADIEREFGTPVELAMLLAAPTLGELEEQLAATESTERDGKM
jgi:aryl carrier-like protein